MLSNIQKTIFFRYPLKYFWYKVCLSFVPDSRIFCSQFQPWPWGIVCSTPWKFPSQCKGENTHRTPRRWFIRRQSTITVLRTSKSCGRNKNYISWCKNKIAASNLKLANYNWSFPKTLRTGLNNYFTLNHIAF